MAVLADIILSGVTYTVYGLTTNVLLDANQYFAASNNATEWTTADTSTKKRSLISAFRAIERQRWSGEKLVSSQETQWPRTGATCNGVTVDDGIPDEIALGEFELALAMMKDATVMDKTSTHSDVKRVKAGSAEVEFFSSPLGQGTRFPTVVQELIGCMLSTSGAFSTMIPLASGTDLDTFFGPDDLELQEPLS